MLKAASIKNYASHPQPLIPSSFLQVCCRHSQPFLLRAAADAAPSQCTGRMPDPYIAATSRLRNLLSGARNGEDEMVDMELAEEIPERKLRAMGIMGTSVIVVAFITTKLLGNDFFGGASLSPDSLHNALLGVALSLPVVALHWWSWQPSTHAQIPAMADMHRTTVARATPWLTNMDHKYAAILMMLEVLPIMMFTFPAGEGAVLAVFGLYNKLVHALGFGMELPDQVTLAAAIMLTAFLAGTFKWIELSPDEQSVSVLESASDNADRYYQLTASSGTITNDPRTAASAFKNVVQAYLVTMSEAADMGGMLTSADVLALGAMWAVTHDLSTVLAASLCINWVEYYFRHEQVMLASSSTPSGNSRSKN